MTRISHKKDYTVLSNHVLRNKNISWKSKGIFAYLCLLPNDWKFREKEIMTHATEKQASFRSGLKELEKYGYLTRVREKENGKYAGVTWIINETPTLKKVDYPALDKPNLDKPNLDNRPLLSTEELSTEKPNTDKRLKDIVQEVVNHLNASAETSYHPSTAKTIRLIKSRIKEGFSKDDFMKVIDKKCQQWKADKKMCKYLRPETLFGTKFESYLNERGPENEPAGSYKNDYSGLLNF